MLDLTFGIKYTPFRSRERGLCALVASIRQRYPQPLLVASNARHAHTCVRLQGGTHVPCALGLSAGRNALVRAATTEFLMILDDDVLFTAATRVERLLAYVADGRASVAAACYSGIRSDSWAILFSNECAAGWFVQSALHPDTVQLQAPSGPEALRNLSGVRQAHVVQNAFVARTRWLRERPWDPRLQTAEDTLWFYHRQRYHDRIVFDQAVRVEHSGNKSKSADYNRRSTRYKEAHFLQWMCKAEPAITRWILPFWTLDCKLRKLQRRFPDDYAPTHYWAQQQMLPVDLAWTKTDCENNPFAVRAGGMEACR